MFLVILVLAVSFFFLFVCLFVLFVLFICLGGGGVGEQYIFRCFSTIQSIDSRCNSTLILRLFG